MYTDCRVSGKAMYMCTLFYIFLHSLLLRSAFSFFSMLLITFSRFIATNINSSCLLDLGQIYFCYLLTTVQPLDFVLSSVHKY